MDTRQPTDIFAVREGLINEYIETSYECPIEKFSRVKVTGEEELLRSINTYYNDVDVNGHINSVKYIEHLLDLWDLDWYRTHFIKRFEIAYVAEAHHGDQLNFYREHREKERENDFNLKITKTTNDNAEVETCRCRVLFSSIL
jgi:putative acyl-ACP thioesterase